MLTRRQLLALPLALALAPLAWTRAAGARRAAAYAADVGILYNALSFRVEGTITERLDRADRRYDVTIRGNGHGVTNHVEASGIFRESRWAPQRMRSRFLVHGRESRLDVAYDYARGTIAYRARGETFVLRRVRIVDDVVAIPEGMTVDDVISAALNYQEGHWRPQGDGTLRTHVVRRHRAPGEGADHAQAVYRAELVPFVLKVVREPDTGKLTALFDLTPFSSWAREDAPGRVVFSPDRRPELITSSLILGTSVAIRIVGAPG